MDGQNRGAAARADDAERNGVSILLTMTEEGAYLRETAQAALASAAACAPGAELIVLSSVPEAEIARQQLSGLPGVRLLPCETGGVAAWNNRGAEVASGDALLFLQEGVILTPEGLQELLRVLAWDEQIGAVGPFSNRTVFSWQYLNAERLEAAGEDAAAWLRTHRMEPVESVFLEHFALLLRRSVFQQAGGFDEAFLGCGGADIDLSFRLKCVGFHLLRVPVYCAHRGANVRAIYDLVRTEMRPLLLDRWGLDIGVPETIWQEVLEVIDWTQGSALIQASCRSALLKAPLVSILIPTYNRPGYFRETLESARAQTYPNIEIIVCDNSTDDRTEALMQKYRSDRRVRYVRNREAKSKAENFMPFERLAQGEFLQWCMDDDILLPDKLTRMVDAFLQEPKATLVTSRRGILDVSGQLTGLDGNDLPLYGRFVSLDGTVCGREMLRQQTDPFGGLSDVLFRRKDLVHHDWRAESRGYAALSDCAMWLELFERGNAVVFGQPLSLHRPHNEQEGGQADAIVRSGIEWKRLIEEYGWRRIFLTEEADYRAALTRVQDYGKETIEPLLPEVAPALRWEYETGQRPVSIAVMNREPVCARIRLDVPLSHLSLRGAISLQDQSGEKDAFYKILQLEDTILLFERMVIVDPVQVSVSKLMVQSGVQGNVVLHEIDDHPVAARNAEIAFSFRAVSAVQTSTKLLADIIRTFNPYVYVFENQLETLPARRRYDRNNQRVTIFFGAFNRRPDWEPLMPAIHAAIHRYGDRLCFRVVSDYDFYQALQTEAKEYVGGVRDGEIIAPYERYTAALHSSDIALLPLNDTEFNRAKSDLKFIESAGHGAVVLASPTVYAATVRDGETGMIYRSPKEFAQKLDLLIRRADLRRTLAENAYRYVAEHRLIDQHLEAYIAAYQEMFARRGELERERLRRVEKFFPNL